MELKHLRAFEAAASLLSFHKAAKQLGRAQSSVSALIKALEDDLGLPLFERRGKRVALTGAGRRLLAYARTMLALADEAKADVAKEARSQGAVSVRLPESLEARLAPAVLTGFRKKHPDVAVRFLPCAADSLEDDLRKGLVDLALLYADAFTAPNLEVETVGYERITPVAAPNHPLAGKNRVSNADLAGETLLLPTSECACAAMVLNILAEDGLAPGSMLAFNSPAALTACAEAGLGAAVVPRRVVASALADGALAVLPWERGEPEIPVRMARHADKWISPVLWDFMDMVRNAAGDEA